MKIPDASSVLNTINSSRSTINLAGGTPLFLVHDFLLNDIRQNILSHHALEYPTHTQGLPALRSRITRSLIKEGSEMATADHIVITAGSTAGLYAVFQTLLHPGDEAIVLSPHWSLYAKQLSLAGATMIDIPLDEQTGWSINLNKVRKAVNIKTKCVLITNPTSPMGTVIPDKNIHALLPLIIKNKIHLVLDETYRGMMYDFSDNDFRPLQPIIDHPRVILVRSFSKELSISGLRVGYVYTNSALIDDIASVHLAMNMTASVLSQKLAIELLRRNDTIQLRIRNEYAKRWSVVSSFLDRRSSVFEYVKPSAGFCVFPRYHIRMPSMELFEILLQRYHVAVRPGIEFGMGGEYHIRISFAYPVAHVIKGLKRLDEFFQKYPQ